MAINIYQMKGSNKNLTKWKVACSTTKSDLTANRHNFLEKAPSPKYTYIQ